MTTVSFTESLVVVVVAKVVVPATEAVPETFKSVANNEVILAQVIMSVEVVAKDLFNWNLKFFKKDKKEKMLFEENILETSFSKKKILDNLKSLFKEVEVADFDSKDVNKKNERLFFVCRK